jgi:TRAP-type C4-dicarboxylate transport system substrate-binding protein
MLPLITRRIFAVPVAAAICAAALGGHAGELPVTHLKVVGGLGATRQYKNFEEPFWTKRLAERSGGRVTAEVAAYDQLGIRGPEVLQLTKLGVLTFATGSLSALASDDPQAAGVDLVGMNGDIASLRRNVAIYLPTLRGVYRERYGVELLAVWTYPAQVIFCKRPITRLAEIAGLKIRTASVMQADFVEALGGIGVAVPYAGIADGLAKDVVDCAITGAISGYVLGLPRIATHLLNVTVNWGPNILVANHAVWQRLAPEVRALIEGELARLDEEIWAAAERETEEGVACTTGAARCEAGPPGHMTLVPVEPEDQTLLHNAFTRVVVPRWAERCGPDCVAAWNETVGRSIGVSAVAEP